MMKEDDVPALGKLLLEPWRQYKRFWRTRTEVMAGHLLRHPAQVASEKDDSPMSAWTFNLTQSATSAAIAKIIVTVVMFFVPITTAATSPSTKLGEEEKSASTVFADAVDARAEKINEWLAVAWPPFALAVIARLMAWGTLKTDDLVSEKKRSARLRFLYLDGALGLFPQILLATGTGLFAALAPAASKDAFVPPETLSQSVAASLAFVVLLIGVPWQYILNNFVIPRRLFLFNGYSFHMVFPWLARGPRGEPYLRYSVVLSVVALLTGTIMPTVMAIVATVVALGVTITRHALGLT